MRTVVNTMLFCAMLSWASLNPGVCLCQTRSQNNNPASDISDHAKSVLLREMLALVHALSDVPKDFESDAIKRKEYIIACWSAWQGEVSIVGSYYDAMIEHSRASLPSAFSITVQIDSLSDAAFQGNSMGRKLSNLWIKNIEIEAKERQNAHLDHTSKTGIQPRAEIIKNHPQLEAIIYMSKVLCVSLSSECPTTENEGPNVETGVLVQDL